jgi:hypothetical protein
VRRAAAALALLALVACRERGRPNPEIRMAISHEREEPAASAPATGNGAGDGSTPAVPTRLEVPPEIEKKYSGIRLNWKDARSGKEGTVEVPLGGEAAVPGSSLAVRADVFLPAFTMSSDRITSTGVEPENPAARIAVVDGGKELFSGWIFARFPDVHPFQHPQFSLRLEGGVPRK